MTVFDNYAEEVGRREIQGNIQVYYRWRIFAADKDSVLDNIEYVEYELSAMPGPYRIATNRDKNFELIFNSWGSFTVRITIKFKNGKEEKQIYMLKSYNPFPK